MYRFHPRVDWILETIGTGEIGEVRSIQTAFTFRLRSMDNIRLDPELGGGALLDVGCYCVNVSRTLMGEEPVEVSARARWTDRGVDDELTGTLYFASGATAQLACSLAQERRESVQIAGTDGWINVPRSFLPGKEAVAFQIHRGRSEVEEVTLEGANQYQRMVEHFADCVHNDGPVRYSAHEAASNLAVIEALYASARKGGAATPV